MELEPRGFLAKHFGCWRRSFTIISNETHSEPHLSQGYRRSVGSSASGQARHDCPNTCLENGTFDQTLALLNRA